MYGKQKITNWKFKKDLARIGTSDDFWYDLNESGYIEPFNILENGEQLQQLLEAISLVRNFEKALEAKGLLDEF